MNKNTYFLAVVVSLAIMGAGCAPAVKKEATNNTSTTNQNAAASSSYCLNQIENVKKIVAQPLPDDYISRSKNKVYLTLWKEIFIKNNGITNDHFQKHIRIINDEIDTFHGEHFSVDFEYIVDWIVFSENNRFVTGKSPSEVRTLFANTNTPHTSDDPTVNALNYITDIRHNGKPIAPTISCEQAVRIVKNKNPDLDPGNSATSIFDTIPGEIRFYTDNEEKICNQADSAATHARIIVGVVSGSVLDYRTDYRCPVF